MSYNTIEIMWSLTLKAFLRKDIVMADKKKIVVVGYGGMGGWHANHLLESDVCELVGVCDISDARRELAVERGLRYTIP